MPRPTTPRHSGCPGKMPNLPLPSYWAAAGRRSGASGLGSLRRRPAPRRADRACHRASTGPTCLLPWPPGIRPCRQAQRGPAPPPLRCSGRALTHGRSRWRLLEASSKNVSSACCNKAATVRTCWSPPRLRSARRSPSYCETGPMPPGCCTDCSDYWPTSGWIRAGACRPLTEPCLPLQAILSAWPRNST